MSQEDLVSFRTLLTWICSLIEFKIYTVVWLFENPVLCKSLTFIWHVNPYRGQRQLDINQKVSSQFQQIVWGMPSHGSLSCETFHSPLLLQLTSVTATGRKETSGTWSDTSTHHFPPANIHLFLVFLLQKFSPSHRRIASDHASDASSSGNSPESQHYVCNMFFPALGGAFNSCHLVHQNSFTCNSLILILL